MIKKIMERHFNANQKITLYFTFVWLIIFLLFQSIYALLPLTLFVLAIFSTNVADKFVLILHQLAKMNSAILLFVTFYLLLTPFSLFYRLLWQQQSFKSNRTSSFRKKESFSSFDHPF